MLRMSKASRESRNDRPLLGESASSFIGEGDGLTSLERERKRLFLRLVAHAVGYKTVLSAPTILLTPRCMWQATSCSSGMANVDVYHTVGQMSAPTALFVF